MVDPVMSRLGDHGLDRALNESWPPDAATTPDRASRRREGEMGWARLTGRCPMGKRLSSDVQPDWRPLP
jgi:hypothetical protein